MPWMLNKPAHLLLILLFASTSLQASGLPERRRDQFAGEFSYFVYPLIGDIPGIGRASGLGASILNIAGSDADFTAFHIDGDFYASGVALLDLPLVKRRLIADIGSYDFNVAQTLYGRGINSSHDDYILPQVDGSYQLGQVTATFDERRYEGYVRVLSGSARLIDVRNSDGAPFQAVDTTSHDAQAVTLGTTLDLTDDRLDPRSGVRFEVSATQPRIDDPLMSHYYVINYNLTGYLPVRRHHDTLVFNLFQSDAHVTRMGETDYATLQAERGLNCAGLPTLQEQSSCYTTESRFLNDMIAANRYGTATALGGTQRLRSYDNGRFYAAHALSYGIEYRLNLTDEYKPFDIFFARGVRTGLQLAFFAEQGSVAEHTADLWHNQRTSYGAGFRVILTGVVLRADLAKGNEGTQFQLFISYPWSMFSVDHPT